MVCDLHGNRTKEKATTKTEVRKGCYAIQVLSFKVHGLLAVH